MFQPKQSFGFITEEKVGVCCSIQSTNQVLFCLIKHAHPYRLINQQICYLPKHQQNNICLFMQDWALFVISKLPKISPNRTKFITVMSMLILFNKLTNQQTCALMDNKITSALYLQCGSVLWKEFSKSPNVFLLNSLPTDYWIPSNRGVFFCFLFY